MTPEQACTICDKIVNPEWRACEAGACSCECHKALLLAKARDAVVEAAKAYHTPRNFQTEPYRHLVDTNALHDAVEALNKLEVG